MDIDIHHPHDSLFKKAFKNKAVAKDFFQNRLSKALLKRINLHTLQLENSSFISHNLKVNHSDLVFSAQIDSKKGYIYLLIECQMREDSNMIIRLLEYNVALMRQHLAQGAKKLPVIFNLVLYAGKAPYKGAQCVTDAFETPDLFLQSLTTQLIIDLNREESDKILQDKKAALAELLLRQAQERDFCKFLEKEGLRLSLLINESEYSLSATLYMLAIDPHDAQQVLDKLDKLEAQNKQTIMNALARLEQQAEKKGMQQGMQQGRDMERKHTLSKIKQLVQQGHISQEIADKMLRLGDSL